ncbi:MAG: 2-C-methyl-D-erythritol 4-phosphate cytidylyltransferase, partial [Pseudomonadota bacterium]|nr:2-C-methyl-D-erythritol 4-phosphate cytidylyltransferase [Pseudomonadota bacterium]
MKGKRIALLVAAGSGARTGAAIPKQYAQLAGKPLITHAVDHLRHPLIDEIRVVIGEGQQPLYQAALGAHGLPAPIIGGATRQQSVRNGLEAVAADPPAQIFIHDAARPFLPAAVIERLAEALTHSDAVVPALPVVDSLARDE